MTISLDDYIAAHGEATVSFVTAAEDPIPDTKPVPVVKKPIRFTMTCPLVTLRVMPAPRV